MTEWRNEFDDGLDAYRPSLPRKIFVRAAPALAAFSFSAAVALRLAGGLASQAVAPQPPAMAKATPELAAGEAPAANGTAGLQAAAPLASIPNLDLTATPTRASLTQPRNPFGGLFDPEGEDRGMPALTAQTDPVGPAFSPLQSEPLFTLVDTPDAGVAVAEASLPTDLKPSLAAVETTAMVIAAAEASVAPLPPIRPQGLVAPRETANTPEDVKTPNDADQASTSAARAPLPPRREIARETVREVAEIETPAEPQIKAPEAAAPTTPGPTRAAARRLRGQPAGSQLAAQTLAPNDPRSFFDKLFHGEPEQRGPQLAYASPGGGGLFGLGGSFPASPAPVSARGGAAAVYDISAHTVYLPNGETLEAHSGLGAYFDHPGFVHVKMRGATPPATYRLTLRESLFHGVQALRLTPVNGNVYGRNGLLAHTFMLGARGDSNGCVSFRDYHRFLNAFMRGEISELRVVASR